MESGFYLYFLIVYGLGGLLLLGLVLYLLRQFVIRRQDRPAWAARTRHSKMVLTIASLFTVALILVPLRVVWATREGAIAGKYYAEGDWGNARLELKDNGNFVETWHFSDAYSGKPEGDGSIEGRWHSGGRNWLSRSIVLEPFRPLAEYDRGHTDISVPAIVEGYSGVTAINVDPVADIVFLK